METALKAWEFENNVQLADPHRDALYGYDADEQRAVQDAKEWRKNVHHFQCVRISAVALLKMVMHARSGGALEVMGLMQGKIAGDTFIVTDAFRLPVEGTETRVNAQEEANEYMPAYLQRAREAGQLENAVGWYHSHPGYGCWLSGIDVGTQMTQQMFQDPFLAVVIDPDRTVSAGKVDIGAFRTYPENYKRPAELTSPSSTAGDAGGITSDGYQTIPLAKIEDFGVHSGRYYQLEVSHFKSSLDAHLLELLWNKYWVGTLSGNPLFANRDYSSKQMRDAAQKIRKADAAVAQAAKLPPSFARGAGMAGPSGGGGSSGAGASAGGRDAQLDRVVRDTNKITGEEIAGLLAGVVKERLFNGVAVPTKPAASGPAPAPEASTSTAEKETKDVANEAEAGAGAEAEAEAEAEAGKEA
ncbi:MAG: COP9 signalosome catalytic subunit rri1 [Thelocarpon impressellum]|nr:MAG: COP9 signalosome catalytic subunit rri1 [Thelocarpon impressellum]